MSLREQESPRNINFIITGEKMPIIRKLLKIGNSQAITIPKSWITNAEKTGGCTIREISLEVDGEIIIRPVIEKKVTPEASCE